MCVFEPFAYEKVLGDLRDCRLPTPPIVSRSRIQVCGITEGS